MATLSLDALPYIKKLYYQKGLGAPKIADKLGVSLDAVYYFMRHNGLTRRSFSEENKLRFSRKKPTFRVKRRLSAKERELQVAGVMLYWAEGHQTSTVQIVDFANSKPDMIRLFLKFLRRVYRIDESKIRAYLYCYSNQNARTLIKFWSTTTKIPPQQFTKPYIRSDFNPAKIDRMPFGLLHVRYYDKKLLNLIRDLIKEFSIVLGR